MSFLGMGPMEILVVLLLAFILLGPKRMVDAARQVNRMVGEVRRLGGELTELVEDEDESHADQAPAVPGGPVPFRPTEQAVPQDDAGPPPTQETP